MKLKKPAMESADRQFVLLVPQTGAGEKPALQVIAVPEGPSFLITAGSRPPRLVRRKPARCTNSICVEPVFVHRRPFLLLLQGGEPTLGHGIRHNGRSAWPANLLRVKDELRIDGMNLFVSSTRGSSVFPPEEKHVGVVCPLCTVAIAPGTLVFSCGSCSALLHCEDERWPAEQRLECARLTSTCPTCHQDIDFKEGLQWEPEL